MEFELKDCELFHDELSYFENEFKSESGSSSGSSNKNNTLTDCFHAQIAATKAKTNFDLKLEIQSYAAMMGKAATSIDAAAKNF